MYFIGGILLICMGLLMLLRPEVFHELTEGWKNRNSEPSDLYCKSTRFGGILCILAGFCGVISTFL